MPPNNERIGLLGLGLMGTALTERLRQHGHHVLVWNRTRDQAGPLIARGAEWSDNPLAASERVIISLYTSDVVEEVLAQLDAGLHAGQILLDPTTGEPEQPAALAEGLAFAEALAVSRAAAPEVMAGRNADSRARDVKQRWMAWSGAPSGA